RGTPPPGPPGRRPSPARRPEQPTDQLRRPYRPAEGGPTQRIPRPQSPADASPTEQIWRPPPPPTSPPRAEKPEKRRGRRFSRMSIILIVVIVIALIVGGLAGGELYARYRADKVLTEVAQCVVQDGA